MIKIESKEGYVFAKKDRSQVYENILYLGIYDSVNNYIEVSAEEAIGIKSEIEANRLEEEAKKVEELNL